MVPEMEKVQYHITENGDVYECHAHKKPCQYRGKYGVDNHFETPQEARDFYESCNESFGAGSALRRSYDESPTPLRPGEVTGNMKSYKDDLLTVNQSIKDYDKYRKKTGRHNEARIPPVPDHLQPYVRYPVALQESWQNYDYDGVRRVYGEALRSYYMEHVFNSDDVDCLFDDDEVEGLLGMGQEYSRYRS